MLTRRLSSQSEQRVSLFTHLNGVGGPSNDVRRWPEIDGASTLADLDVVSITQDQSNKRSDARLIGSYRTVPRRAIYAHRRPEGQFGAIETSGGWFLTTGVKNLHDRCTDAAPVLRWIVSSELGRVASTRSMPSSIHSVSQSVSLNVAE